MYNKINRVSETLHLASIFRLMCSAGIVSLAERTVKLIRP